MVEHYLISQMRRETEALKDTLDKLDSLGYVIRIYYDISSKRYITDIKEPKVNINNVTWGTCL